MTDVPNPGHLTLVEQLRAVAFVSAEVNTFTIVRDGRTIEVIFAPGSTDSLTLKVRMPTADAETRRIFDGYRGGKDPGPVVAPRPLSIKLAREDEDDKKHKADGINREIQTGDPQFDDVVYIDTFAPPDAVRGILASKNARLAAMELLARDCLQFFIDDLDGNISMEIIEFTTRSPDQERGSRLLETLARFANEITPVRASGETPAQDPTLLPIGCGCATAFAGLILTPVVYFTLTPTRCLAESDEGTSLLCGMGPECCNPGFTGLIAGALTSIPLILILGRVIRGNSDSHSSMRVFQVTALFICCEIGVMLARFLF